VPCRLLNCFQALSSLSVASVLSVQASRSRVLDSISARQSSLESVASVRSESIESEASVQRDKLTTRTFGDSSTTTTSDAGNRNRNSNSNSNVALVGGVIGAFLGAAVLALIGVLLWRRTRGVPASSKSIHPDTSTSLAFSTNTNHIGGPPVTHAVQPGWYPKQSSFLSLPSTSVPAATQASITSRQSSSPPPAVKMWIEGPPTIHQETHRRLASQSRSLASPPTGGPVDPRGLYRDAVRGLRPLAQFP